MMGLINKLYYDDVLDRLVKQEGKKMMTLEVTKIRVVLEELVKIMNEIHKDLEELRKE